MKTWFKKSFQVLGILVVGCAQREITPSFLTRVLSASKEQITKEYYIPAFHEKDFPSPQYLLKKLPPYTNQRSHEYSTGPQMSGKVALTFDACSTLLDSRFDSAVAGILISTNTPATIFLGGKWVLDRPRDAKYLASIPFLEIGNHSYVHGHLTRVSDARLYYEILWTQEIIYTVTGKIPIVFRPPYLENDVRVMEVAARLGLKTISGDLPSGDPDENASRTKLIDEIKYHVKGGSIVIMHINKGGKHTAEALPEIIRLLKIEGYELVTVSQMLQGN